MKDKYSKEYCHEIALKYKHKKDFVKEHWNIYMFAYRRNYLNEICSHMIILNNNSKRMIYRFVFPDNICYVGLTFNLKDRIYRHTVSDKDSAIYKHILETKNKYIIQELTDYIDVSEAIKMEKYWMNKSIEDGFVLLNRSEYNSIGGNNTIWGYNNCKIEALKYNHKVDMKHNSKSAYNRIIINKWFELFEHMVRPKNYNSKWTHETCKQEAIKYENMSDFRVNGNSAYQYAVKHKILTEIKITKS